MVDRILRIWWTSCCVLWLSFGIAAAPPLTITDGGYYLTYVDESGVPSLVEVETVVDLRSGNTPAPDPPNPGPEDPDDPTVEVDYDKAVVKLVMDSAKLVNDSAGCQAFEAVYEHVAGAFEDDLLDSSSVWTALKVATDDALTITSESVNWSPFRASLSALITEKRQRGLLQSKPEVYQLLMSVGKGASMAGDDGVSPPLTGDQIKAIAIQTNEAIDAK